MITLTGMLDLNKEQAPAVTLRIGDTMRQTELTVDNAVDLSDCTAELYMVKPDSTFVIAACTITEDNSIIVSWPEQAAAVKGLGEYCVRITSADPAYVYSARGPVWIDDHVITEDMIESVAEVNGYTFPDDFALRSEIPTVDSFIDDDNVESDKTWSSAKLNDIFTEFGSAIESLQDYSTTEKVVGKWIDGSTVYQITYDTGSNHFIAGNGSNWSNTIINTTGLNISKVLSCAMLSNEGYIYNPLGCAADASVFQVLMPYNMYYRYMTIRYLKTV